MNLALLKEKNILFVENDEGIIDSIQPVLEKFFHKVYISRSGEEGLETFEKNQHIDFVITDLKMSNMDGLDMVANIKALKETPSILMSADGDYESFLRADEIGIYRYMLKPLDIQDLLQAIVYHIENNS